MNLWAGLFCLLLSAGALAEEAAVLEAMQDYLEFAAFDDGILSPTQLRDLGLAQFHIIDTRETAQYAAGHIADARHIDWREVLARRA
jgi:hypothetical protein